MKRGDFVIKKIISVLFVAMLMASLLTTSAFAAPKGTGNSIDATQMSPEVKAYAERLMKNRGKPKRKQIEEKTVMSDGTVLYITELDTK